MTNLDSILKSRDIILPTKVHLVKAVVFPVVMYGCESWTVKKAECQKIDAFELWCWKRLLRVPWTARRSNQSILKEISPGCSLTDAEADTPILWPPHVKSWWWTGRPGMPWFMGSQRVGHSWATELNWMTEHMDFVGIYLIYQCRTGNVNVLTLSRCWDLPHGKKKKKLSMSLGKK